MKELNKAFILNQLVLAIRQLDQSKKIVDFTNYEKIIKTKIEYYLDSSLVDNVYEEEFKLLVYYELNSYKAILGKIQIQENPEDIVSKYIEIKKQFLALDLDIKESVESFSNLSIQVSEGLIKEVKIKYVELHLKKELLSIIKDKINTRSENILKLLQILD